MSWGMCPKFLKRANVGGNRHKARGQCWTPSFAARIIPPVSEETKSRRNPNPFESLIFASRWLQAPLYAGLIVAQCVYVYQFLVELWHLLMVTFGHVAPAMAAHGGHDVTATAASEAIMLSVLGLIDVVMIANLLIMVIIGGYETFVSRLDLHDHPDQPEWLSHVNAGVLKVKLATALVGISSIHLLKSFIEADRRPEQAMKWQVIIHLVFVISALVLAWTDRVMVAGAKQTTH